MYTHHIKKNRSFPFSDMALKDSVQNTKLKAFNYDYDYTVNHKYELYKDYFTLRHSTIS